MHSSVHISFNLSVYLWNSDTVLVLGENLCLRIRNSAYTAILCTVDGAKSQDDIVQNLADRYPPEHVFFCLQNLMDRGVLVEGQVPKDLTLEDLAFWDSVGVDARFVIATLGEKTVAVTTLGKTAEAGRAIVACLEQSGFAVVERSPDIAVVVTDDYLNVSLREIAERNWRTGIPWLSVRPLGQDIWIGPYLKPARSPCWGCLETRLRGNRRWFEDDLRNKAESIRIRTLGSVVATRGLAGSMVATTLLKILADESGNDADSTAITTLNPLTLVSRQHVVRAVHDCPMCADARRVATDWSGRAGAVRRRADAELLALADDLIGTVRPPKAIGAGPDTPVHVVSAPQPLPVEDRAEDSFEENDDAAFGKGWTHRDAQLSCIGEAVERYSAAWRHPASEVRASLVDLAEPALSPVDLLGFSEAQYRSREQWNARHGGTAWVPEPFDSGAPILWTPVRSLVEERQVLVPSAYCCFGRFDPVANKFMRANSNGCAAGRTQSDATARALLELIERDAVAIWWYNRVRRPAVDLDAANMPGILEIRDWARRANRDLVVLDIATDIPVPSYVALSWDTATGGDIVLGSAADPNPVVAISRALMEMCQLHTVFRVGLAATGTFSDTDTPTRRAALQWHRERTTASEPYVVPCGTVPLPSPTGPSTTEHDIVLDYLVGLLRDHDLHAYGLDMTHPDLGIPVARTVVPGLRHFWPRYGPGRLYDVPVVLGWLERPTAEDDLNPVPLFV